LSDHDPPAARSTTADARSPSTARADVLGLVVIAVFSALLVFGVVGVSSRMTQSWHGLFHTAIVQQLAHGVVPPTNPLSLGAPVGYPWFWHLGLATLVRALDVTPFAALLVASTLSLATFLGATWIGCRRLVAGLRGRIAACLLPLVVMNPLGPPRFLVEVAAESRDVVLPSANELLPVQQLLGVALDGRAGSPLSKFLNFNAMPAGLALFAVVVLFLSSRRSRSAVWSLLGVPLALVLALVYPHAGGAAGIAALAAGVGALVERRSPDGDGLAERRRAPDGDGLARRLAPPIAVATGLALAAPLVLWVSSGFGSGAGDGARRGIAENTVAVGWALAPLVALCAVALPLLRRLSSAARFQLLCGVLLAGASLVPLPADTQYKFPLLASVPASLLLLGVGRALLGDPSRRGAGARRVASAATNVGLALGALVVAASVTLRLKSAWARFDPFDVKGSTIDLAPNEADGDRAARQAAYAWIREHTPPTAFVLERPVDMNDLELTAVTGRRAVAARPTVFTEAVPYHPYLVDTSRALVDRLAACTVTTNDVERLFAVPAPWPLAVHALARMHDGHGTAPACARPLPDAVTVAHDAGRYVVFRVRAPSPSVSAAVRAAEGRLDDVSAQYAAATERQLAGDLAGSLPFLERVEELSPGYERALFLHGWALQRLGRWDEAQACYERFVAAQPDFVQARFNLACGLADAGRHAEAIEELHEVLRRDAEHFRSAHHWLARSYAALGDGDAAARHEALYEELRGREDAPR